MILHSIKKELILVSQDLHSIAVLFLLPIIFMLLMTYAMSEKDSDIIESIQISISEKPPEKNQSLYVAYMSQLGYDITHDKQNTDASIIFDNSFEQSIFSSNSKGVITVDFNKRTSLPMQSIIRHHLQLAFARLKLHLFLLETAELDDSLSIEQQMALVIKQSDTSHLIDISAGQKRLPVTAYSVPSWLIFGVYFIVLPISITLINEQHSGTLMRLKTFPVSLHLFFLLKLLAFWCISVVQLLILSLVGLRIIPILIDLPPIPIEQLWGILWVGCFISLSAVCFAAIIAASIKSFEQAVVLGGGINIILAAMSGFMVPLDVMPQSLQNIAEYSPMFWSAELIKVSMFELPTENLPLDIARLCLFSLVCLGISLLIFSRKIRKLQWN